MTVDENDKQQTQKNVSGFHKVQQNSEEISYLLMHRIRQRLISFRLGIIHLTSFFFHRTNISDFFLSNGYTVLWFILYMCFLTLLRKPALTRQIQTGP